MAAAPQKTELQKQRLPGPEPYNRYRRRVPQPGEKSQNDAEWSLNPTPKGAFVRSFCRLLEVLATTVGFWAWVFLGELRIWDKDKRSARRAALFLQYFQTLGGAYIKVGQQLSIRQDLLPPEYCDALTELLDDVDAFPFEQAREAIEKQIGGKIESVFTNLNPVPIGKGSIACVYEAWLRPKPGKELTRVVVKVRRPGIVDLFAADLRSLDWVLTWFEGLTVFRGGVTTALREQLKEILFEELDFKFEARYQEIFRREYRKQKRFRIVAPKVFYKYSGEAVIVSEFMDAIPLNSVMSAVDVGDEEYLAYLSSLGIEPVRLAKRLLRYNFHAFFEDTFFHGDPHPANIMVLPGNKLVFIDFGACGTFSKRDRHLMVQMHYQHSQKNIRGMVESVMALMEPLPPMDEDKFRRKLEKQYWDGYYCLQSKHSDWRDRTSYRLWVALFNVVREFKIPMPLNMVRMIRATLLYDTIAAHLFNQVDVFEEFRKYEKHVAVHVRAKLWGDVCRQMMCGPDLEWYMTFNRVLDIAQTAIFRIQKFIDEPFFNPMAIVDKVAFAFTTAASWAINMLVLHGLLALAVAPQYMRDHHLSPMLAFMRELFPWNWGDELYYAWPFKVYIFFALATTFTTLRALKMRLMDPDR